MRETKILELRPVIVEAAVSNALAHETFQNRTLRPILKLQHQITAVMLDSNSHFSKLYPKASLLTQDQYAEAIEKFIKANKEFRNQLIGMITGLMTVEEYKTYLTAKSEYNKRMVTMQAKRYINTFAKAAKDTGKAI